MKTFRSMYIQYRIFRVNAGTGDYSSVTEFSQILASTKGYDA